jgi:histone-arginine methyltransferase CARM1
MTDLQLASWFDLDFVPRRPSNSGGPAAPPAWNYQVGGASSSEWPWSQLASNPLNPEPTPPPPANGLDVTLSTGPSGKWIKELIWA